MTVGNSLRVSFILLATGALGTAVACGGGDEGGGGGGSSGSDSGGTGTGSVATTGGLGGTGLTGSGGVGLAATGGTGLTGSGSYTATGGSGTGGAAYSLLESCTRHECTLKTGVATDLVIDSIEAEGDDTDGTRIAALAGRLGYWYAYQDTSAGGEWTSGIVGGNPALQSTDAAVGNAFVVEGVAFSEWGAGVGLGLDAEIGAECPYDASVYAGVKFQYKSTAALAFMVKTDETSPCDGNGAGLCAASCHDHFMKSLPAATAWTEACVTFAELRTAGWGTPSTATFDATGVLGMQWQVGASNASFTLGVDEVEFVTACP